MKSSSLLRLMRIARSQLAPLSVSRIGGEKRHLVKFFWDGSPGSPAVYLKNVSIDDFIFDSSGNLYLAANRSGGLIANEIERVKPDGTYTTLARDADDLDEPSAIEFGTGTGEQGKLYITNIGMFSAAKHPSLKVLSINV